MTPLEAIKFLADYYNLEPGDHLKVTINHVGNPSIEYSRKITPERIEDGSFED